MEVEIGQQNRTASLVQGFCEGEIYSCGLCQQERSFSWSDVVLELTRSTASDNGLFAMRIQYRHF